MAPGRGRCGSRAGAVGGGDDVGGGGVQVRAAAWDHGLAAGGGVIITSSSGHGLLMAPTVLVSGAGTSAVVGMTRQIVCDSGPLGIQANALCPGHIVAEPIRAPSPPARWQVVS